MNNFEVLVLDLNIATILLLQYIDLIKKNMMHCHRRSQRQWDAVVKYKCHQFHAATITQKHNISKPWLKGNST